MKTKMKNLALLIFLAVTLFSNAQDSSNDATWEETIDFLNENDSFFLAEWYYNKANHRKTLEFRIDDYRFLKIKHKSYQKYVSTYVVDLDHLFKVSLPPDNGVYENWIFLKVSSDRYGKLERLDEETAKSKKYDADVFSVFIKDKLMYPRILKAFQHLNYLANKKREKERAASGSKF